MQNETSVEIVDASPHVADNETILKTNNIAAGATILSEEELHHLFQLRNLVFLSTCPYLYNVVG